MFVNLKKTIIILLLLLIVCYTECSLRKNDCFIKKKEKGKCTLIKDCSKYNKIHQDTIKGDIILMPDQYQLIYNNTCGINRVCCPINLTETVRFERLETTSQKPSFNNISNHPNLYLINNLNCGHLIDQDKIYDGTDTELHEFPWMAIIQYNKSNVIEQKCGGTVISQKYILTAAHCVMLSLQSTDYKLHSVLLGEHNKLTNPDCDSSNTSCADPVKTFEIMRVDIHHKYNTKTFSNDIALIRLKESIKLSDRGILPICLPITEKEQNAQLIDVIVTGWGRTKTNLPSQILQKTNLNIINNTYCMEIYKNHGYDIISEKNLCTLNTNNDACKGDSGGPISYPIQTTSGPKQIQYGIVSFGTSKCEISEFPAVFVKIVPYMQWILNNIRP